ncbi:CoA-binding protein [Pseudooceanicola sp. CBS1P-1]|uniref:CoA-binding protein n=1 Tax=Pseudooceanicola albus TaxID=2692189 RepID=A0A6L7FYB7_9RHOB|nr:MULTISPECIES: CoA-binding protein [Pseudooceanicola]MBT9383371.1 CoA-binding protein [Pseudooceanicola endophyticus]MXN16306.1 CoA-binding protein [Pseudooceanicola albus]
MDDAGLRRIFEGVSGIAVVGWSPKPERPSHRVAEVLRNWGYLVVPVNPGAAGQPFHDQAVCGSLAEVGARYGARVQMLDVFRRGEAVPAEVAAALSALPGLAVVWMQLGVVSPQAAAQAEAAGLEVVMDRCPAIELPRLYPEGVVSSS